MTHKAAARKNGVGSSNFEKTSYILSESGFLWVLECWLMVWQIYYNVFIEVLTKVVRRFISAYASNPNPKNRLLQNQKVEPPDIVGSGPNLNLESVCPYSASWVHKDDKECAHLLPVYELQVLEAMKSLKVMICYALWQIKYFSSGRTSTMRKTVFSLEEGFLGW